MTFEDFITKIKVNLPGMDLSELVIKVLARFLLYFQSLGCDRPVNYKTEKLDAVLKKEFPVSAY